MTASTSTFVPEGFEAPRRLDHPSFILVPLGPEHNASDHAAWTSSMAHIHATPGFEDYPWPHPMTLEENLGDLVRHAQDFADRTGFTYTVLAPDGPDGADPAGGDAPTVIGCVYIYPATDGEHDTRVKSWVRAADAALDGELYAAVSAWLARDWPFTRIDYAVRPG